MSDATSIAIETTGLVMRVTDFFDDRLSEARRELEEAVKNHGEVAKRYHLAQRHLTVIMRGMVDADRIIPWQELRQRSNAHNPMSNFMGGAEGSAGGFWTHDWEYTAPDGSLHGQSTFHYLR